MERFTSRELADMIDDRDLVSLAHICRDDMWAMIRVVAMLPDFMPGQEIDEFLMSIQEAQRSMNQTHAANLELANHNPE